MIFHLDGTIPTENNAVWVFGSNLAGRHGAGAALIAREFGARLGHGVGRQGQSYAIPTKDARLRTLSLAMIAPGIAAFIDHARARLDEAFFVTRIGCGLAGWRDCDIAPMFKTAPGNCSFAREWRSWLES